MTMFKNRPGLVLVAGLLGALLSSCTSPDTGEERFVVVEATIPEMQRAMEEGRLTSRALVEAHLLRIALYEERVNAAIATNANALTEADRLDQERAEGRVRGPLHGVPVALKDNVHTTHMPTTGGALAFEGFVPPYEATLTTNLREAGAIILAKTVMAEAIEILMAQGATIVDPADIPSVIDPDPANNLLASGGSSVLNYGMKRDFNAWLATLGESAPVGTLTELREWNLAHEGAGSLKYAQARLDGSDEIDLDEDRAEYEADRARDLYLNGEHGIDEVMIGLELDALLFPGSSGASISARPGYPTVIVPFGFLEDAGGPPMPEGFDAKPRPFGVSFAGMECSEPRLIELAYAFEQATMRRVAPPGMR